MKINLKFEGETRQLGEKEQTLLDMLEDDLYFEKRVREIRKKCGINENNFEKLNIRNIKNIFFHQVNESLVRKKETLVSFLSKIDKDFSLTTKLFFEYKNFPADWWFPFYTLVKNNVFLIFSNLEKIEVIRGEDLSALFRDKFESRHLRPDIYIKIRDQINKSDLINFIKENFDDKVKPLIEKDLAFQTKIVSKNLSNLFLYKEIFLMKNEGNTSKEMAEILNKKYKRNSLNDSKIRDMLSEYKKQIRNLR